MKRSKKWTEDEENLLLELYELNISVYGMSQRLGRSEKSISQKLSDLKKEEDTYNDDHIKHKYYLNHIAFDAIKPKTILDLFAGKKRFWFTEYSTKAYVFDNDIKPFGTIFNEDANNLVSRLDQYNLDFDLIDIDPFGAPSKKCLEFALKHAKKGIIITDACAWSAVAFHDAHGREDYFKQIYKTGTENREGNYKDLVAYVQNRRPDLDKFFAKEWGCCWRVYIYKGEEES